MEKLRAIRGGHRSAVSRLIGRTEEKILEDLIPKQELRAALKTLESKKELLQQLDHKILDDTETENVEQEILHTDEFNLSLETAIQRFEDLLSKFQEPIQPTVSNLTNISATQTTSFPLSSTDINANNLYTNGQEGMSTSNVQINTASSNSLTGNLYHKLPKLELPTFAGDILMWKTFWDSFESTVHGNPMLTDVQKFNYLKNQLHGIAAQSIAGLQLTGNNYLQAVSILMDRFGQEHKIINAHIQSLIELTSPRSNPESLTNFFDKMECCIRGLESLGTNETSYGAILTPMIYNKLPAEIRRTITRDKGDDNWDLQSLRRAIKKELCVQNTGQLSQSNSRTQDFIPTANFVTGSSNKKNSNKLENHVKHCLFCGGNHAPTNCQAVTDFDRRIAIVKEKRVCFNCFGKHRVNECKSHFKCKNCKKAHHTSICRNSDHLQKSTGRSITNSESTQEKQPPQNEQSSQLHSSSHVTASTEVLLKTAVTPLWYRNQETIANVLLDEGAQNSFITEELACKLDIVSNGSITLKISAFGDGSSEVRHLQRATVQLETQHGAKIPMEVIIIPKIAAPITNRSRINIKELSYLKGLKLAHPVSTDEEFHISMLIGADYYWEIVGDRVIRGNGPTAVESKIGYLISGPIHSSEKQHSAMFHVLADHKLEEIDLEKFWRTESLGISDDEEDVTGKKKISEYASTSVSKQGGHYVAKIPWKENSPCLPTNYEIVKRRTENVIHRLAKDPTLLKMYGKIIQEQENRGFIEKVDDSEKSENRIHYIPHHPVRKDSATTPIRIVYDCSCKDRTGKVSLNDCIESHSPVVNDITTILTRFRLNKYAVSADIEKAFLQIQLDKRDRDATRFLWLSDNNNPSSPLTTYRFRSVLFGATCSPFILSATLMKHFEENANGISSILEQNLYVDNVLASFPSEEAVMNFYKESRTLLATGGFNLRSWSSNSQMLQELSKAEKTMEEDSIIKVLGMRWNPQEDTLQYSKNDFGRRKGLLATKREVLKESSKVFDPLGILSPITVKAKIFMQELWKTNLKWDQKLPAAMQSTWMDISTEVSEALDTKISRNVSPSVDSTWDSLHVFTDASQQAYGACVYLLSNNKTTLLMGKNRVSKIKQTTLPRLELMGAVIGARLAKHVQESTGISKIYFWCDSQIVLHWIMSQNSSNKFVINRVKEIRKISGSSSWRYCPTNCNPADYLTRGITLKKFKEDTLWWNGPTWLNEPEKWPVWSGPTNTVTGVHSTYTEEEDDTNDHAENQVTTVNKTTSLQSILKLEDRSSFMVLVKVVAYIRRFIHNCRHSKQRKIGFLSKEELNVASRVIIQDVQRTEFTKEIAYLKHPSGKRPTLIQQLKLFIDSEELLRCGGRIHNAPLMEKTKFPYLLPTSHQLTYLIVIDTHNRNAHAILNSTITLLHEQYWIPRIRQCVKGILRGCVSCRKVIGKSYQTLESPPLPKDRLQMKSPFTVTGVDFTGPLYIKDASGEDLKVYICLFTCASTRALHLELVPNLSQSSFLLAFRRFISRRSMPSIMISDNATCFQSAARELSRPSHSEKLHQKLAEYGVQWKFIPSRAPWYGGWWERLIGLTKTSLLKVLGRSKINMETLHTIITEIEAMLNDRPLTYISTDLDDLQPLAPSQLLYGRRLTSLPYTDESDVDTHNHIILNHENANEYNKQQIQILQNFWNRWKTEYLTSLRQYHRTTGTKSNKIKIGDVVQVHDDFTKRINWKLAVVVDLTFGKDGLARSAVLRFSNGTVTNRPITKLYPLELNERVPVLRRSERLSKLS